MKLALCLEYPLELKGGVSILCRALAEALSARYEVALVSPDSAEEFSRLQRDISFHSHVRWNPETVSRGQSRALAEALRERGVQLAHFHFGGNYGWGSRLPGGSPLPYATHRGIRVFSTVHSVVGLLTGYCGPAKPAWFKLALLPVVWLAKMHLLGRVEREIAVSQHDLKLLQRWYRPYADRFVQIYHSRLSDTEAPQPRRRDQLILNAGHIAWRKGQPVLLEAFSRIAARFPEWNLALVGHFGDADVEQQIRSMIAGLGLEDRVLSPGAQHNIADWMRRAAIYVQPSLEEALGLALQEAMFYGCACIGTRVGGIPELLQPGTGVLVNPEDSAELAASLIRLIEDSELREKFGAAAASSVRARAMTAEAMIQRHIELYESP